MARKRDIMRKFERFERDLVRADKDVEKLRAQMHERMHGFSLGDVLGFLDPSKFKSTGNLTYEFETNYLNFRVTHQEGRHLLYVTSIQDAFLGLGFDGYSRFADRPEIVAFYKKVEKALAEPKDKK